MLDILYMLYILYISMYFLWMFYIIDKEIVILLRLFKIDLSENDSFARLETKENDDDAQADKTICQDDRTIWIDNEVIKKAKRGS